MKIKIKNSLKSRINEVDFNDLEFCKYYSDHMFSGDYVNGEWNNFQILPYENLSISPACATLHYGQTIFEGLKAYKNDKDEILIFRPEKNAERFNISSKRMCIPEFPKNLFLKSIIELLKIDKKWIPNTDNSSLYIRPLIFALDPYIGIKPADNYKFIIITAPAGGYYTKPVKVKIETKYTRAISGGVGFSKTAANYAAALYPSVKAQKDGYDQLIWTDGKEHKYVEESGTMNLFFVIDETIITAPLGDTVLDGVTRDSIIVLANKLNLNLEVRKISIGEVISSIKNGKLREAFGAGTAATVAPIKTIGYESKDYDLPEINSKSYSSIFLEELNNIKYGKSPDLFNWITKV